MADDYPQKGSFRKKPVEVEAFRWEGDLERLYRWLEGVGYEHRATDPGIWRENETIVIATLEGEMRADPGDYIIQGVQGEFYPCKPDIFRETYEPAPAHKEDDGE